MKIIGLVLALLVLPLSYAAAQDYRLNPGDAIAISVWKEPDLQREMTVLPDGTISFPLAGQVNAAGMTPGELEGALGARLQRFVPDPVITVTVINPAGNKVYVTGEVNRPGVYPLLRPTSVMQALATAGGISPFANEDAIHILRNENGEMVTISFDYDKVQSGDDLSGNIELQSGDTIIVPEAGLF